MYDLISVKLNLLIYNKLFLIFNFGMLYFLLFNLFMTIVAVNISNNLFEKHLYKRSKPFGVISKFCFPILFGLLTWGTCYILYLIVFIVLSMSLSPSLDGRAGGAILIYPIIAFFVSIYMVRQKIKEYG
nr:hypothetical protein [Acinetobacter pittii]